MTKYAISTSDGHDEYWYYYDNIEEYQIGFKELKNYGEDDIHGYVLNDNEEYEVIDYYWDGDK